MQRDRHRLDVELGDAPGDAAHRRSRPAARRTAPCTSMRSGTVKRSSRGTSGRGLTMLMSYWSKRLSSRDLDHVAEAVGRDERGARALALDDGVGGERGAVHEHADVAERQARLGQHAAGALDDGHLRLRAAWSAAWRRGGAPRLSSTMSVKVPPMSTASRADRRFSLMIVVRLLGLAPIRPQPPRPPRGDGVARGANAEVSDGASNKYAVLLKAVGANRPRPCGDGAPAALPRAAPPQ